VKVFKDNKSSRHAHAEEYDAWVKVAEKTRTPSSTRKSQRKKLIEER